MDLSFMKLKNKKLAEEWFERARSDYLYAKTGDKETGQHHITCFLCHQAVEKILKGIITGCGGTTSPPPKTHNLRLLLLKARELAPDLSLADADALKLTAFYIPSRYPGPVAHEFTPKDAEIALEITARLLEAVCAST